MLCPQSADVAIYMRLKFYKATHYAGSTVNDDDVGQTIDYTVLLIKKYTAGTQGHSN